VSRSNVILRVLSVLAMAILIAACQTQVSLEPAPEAIAFAANPRGECDPYTAYWKADNWSEDDWGGDVEATTPPGNGAINVSLDSYPPTFSYTNNSDMDLVRIVVKAGQETSVTSEPGDSGSITWDAPPAISHVTFCFEDGGDDTTTTVAGATTTSAAVDTTSTPGGDTTSTPGGDTTTTIDAETTVTQGGDSTTTPGDDTTTTSAGDTTTTIIGDATVTTDPGATTTSGEGPPVTEGGGGEEPTTTVEVGAGGLTTTPDGEGEGQGQGEGTLDPSQETSTTGDEVAGGSDELPYTGTGQVSLGGLGGLLLGAGAILLLLVRRRSRED